MRAGITGVRGIRISAGAQAYAYSYSRVLSELYVVDGVR